MSGAPQIQFGTLISVIKPQHGLADGRCTDVRDPSSVPAWINAFSRGYCHLHSVSTPSSTGGFGFGLGSGTELKDQAGRMSLGVSQHSGSTMVRVARIWLSAHGLRFSSWVWAIGPDTRLYAGTFPCVYSRGLMGLTALH
jgi:hypothetical protein